jgi:hypothetical protein
MALVVATINVASLALLTSNAGASPPTQLTFQSPPQAVTAGETVQLQWAPVPSGEFVIFALTSTEPSGFDFSSSSDVQWPTPPGGVWNSTYGFWSSTSSSVKIAIPSGLPPTTAFTFSLSTCALSTGCSAADSTTLTVVDMAHMGNSSMTVFAGTTASLHWAQPTHGDFYLFTKASSTYALNFGSSSVVTWPSPAGGSWSSTYGWWSSTANAVSIAIPAGAPAGATFTFDLYTCNLTSDLCSNSSGGPGMAAVTMTVAGSEWSTEPFSNDYTDNLARQSGGGVPLDVAISPSTDATYDDSEFSNSIGVAAAGASSVTMHADQWDINNTPFACSGTACNYSWAGERAVVDSSGLVWITQGGGDSGTPSAPNYSEIVAYDPSSGGMCTYGVPGSNTEVTGLVAIGSGSSETIWFGESGGEAVVSFKPSQVGENCSTSPYYSLSGHTTSVALPGMLVAMITADPNGTTLWATGNLASSIDRIDTTTSPPTVTSYPYSGRNTYGCLEVYGVVCVPIPYPWQVVSDGTYAYAIDYGDANLVRINEATGHMDETPLPLTSDTEQGYGLTMVTQGSDTRLYFTLSQDPALTSTATTFGMATTFGWVDLNSWSATSANPSQGEVYTGLDNAPSDFRGIASEPSGKLAIADSTWSSSNPEGIIQLTPKP